MSTYARPIDRETVHCSLMLESCIHCSIQAVFDKDINNHMHASLYPIRKFKIIKTQIKNLHKKEIINLEVRYMTNYTTYKEINLVN